MSSKNNGDIILMKKVKLTEVLNQLIKDQGISSAELSKECSIPKSTLSTYLSGRKASYSPEHLAALSSYFDVTTDFLLFGEEAESAFLNTLATEGIFEGWLKVKIERAIPKKKGGKD